MTSSAIRCFAAAAIAALSLLSAGGAEACSVVGGFRIPGHRELVDKADAIVVARAAEAVGQGSVRFEVLQRVKGDAPPSLVLSHAYLGEPQPSDPNEIDRANPESMAGGCIRYTFKAGAAYVLFLERRKDGALDQMFMPFSRVNEDYFGDDSLWMRTIRDDLAGH